LISRIDTQRYVFGHPNNFSVLDDIWSMIQPRNCGAKDGFVVRELLKEADLTRSGRDCYMVVRGHLIINKVGDREPSLIYALGR